MQYNEEYSKYQIYNKSSICKYGTYSIKQRAKRLMIQNNTDIRLVQLYRTLNTKIEK